MERLGLKLAGLSCVACAKAILQRRGYANERAIARWRSLFSERESQFIYIDGE